MRAFILSVFHFSLVIRCCWPGLRRLSSPMRLGSGSCSGSKTVCRATSTCAVRRSFRSSRSSATVARGFAAGGATRADLLYDADGNVVRWQAFMEVNDDFHEFDAYLINGEVLIDYIGELASTDEMISATLIFARMSEAEVAALSGGAAADPGGVVADSGDELAGLGDRGRPRGRSGRG